MLLLAAPPLLSIIIAQADSRKPDFCKARKLRITCPELMCRAHAAALHARGGEGLVGGFDHAGADRGVRQEAYAHFALIAATRSLAKEGDDLLALMREKGKPRQTVNFKHALALVAANLEELLLAGAVFAAEAAARAAAWILRARSRLRPGRSYPRVSKKPASKWARRRGKKPKVPKAGAAQPA